MSENPPRPRKLESCPHEAQIDPDVKARTPNGCEECLAMGDSWVHLRICLICGHIGCCNDSKNKHAAKHYEGTGHPLMRSFEPGESWVWCFPDEAFIVKRRPS